MLKSTLSLLRLEMASDNGFSSSKIHLFNAFLFPYILVLLSFFNSTNCAIFTYTDYEIDQSIGFKFLPSVQRKQIKIHLLDFFGLDHVPNPARKDNSSYLKHIHTHLDEDTASLQHDKDIIVDGEILTASSRKAINDSDVIVSFVNQYDQHSDHLQFNDQKRLWFNTRQIAPISENLIKAELRVFRKVPEAKNDRESYEVKVLTYSRKPQSTVIEIVDSIIVTNQSGWLVFNVTGPVEEWIRQPDDNHGIMLSVTSKKLSRNLSLEEFGIFESPEDSYRNPFMIAYFKDSQEILHRKRREGRSHYSSAEKNPFTDFSTRSKRACQRRSLFVGFKELGWQEWIIAPDGYHAYYCDGQCSFPLNAHMNATNHAIIQTLVHLMDPTQVREPSCAPIQLSSIMVLYFDDSGNVILKKYKNMVVKACGCH